jgi:methionyl-tRNA synthetase
MNNFDPQFLTANLIWIVPLMIWDLVWKAIGLWHSARNNQRGWFIALLLINSVGVLPIVYLQFFRKKH